MTCIKLDKDKIWEKAFDCFKEKLPQSIFDAWVKNFVPNSYSENEFSVLCGHRMAINLITPHKLIIEQILTEITGQPTSFKVVYSDEVAKVLRKKVKNLPPSEDSPASKFPASTQMVSCNLNVKFKFDNFIVGSNSELAYAGALAVAKNPGKTAYNPLFIYGNSGVGKTHLLQAIGHTVFEKGLKVKYCNSEEFVNDYVKAVAKGLNKGYNSNNDKMSMLRQKYRNCDVLLLDDIQFIENKEQTQVEIFNTINSLYNSGKQIVLTSDRPPEAIGGLTERLKSRFVGGLLVDIQPPDLETRMAILESLSKEENMPVSKDIIDFLAVNYGANVRELKGAFNRIKLYYDIQKKELDLLQVKKVLNFKENQKNYTAEAIITAVSSYFNVSEEDILGTGRMKSIANARQVAIYLIRELTKDSFPSIGNIFGKKHSTIIYSFEEMKKTLMIDTHLKNAVEEIQKGLE